MLVRRFVRRSIEIKKKLFLILLLIAAISGLGAFTVQHFWGQSGVYRATVFHEARPTVNIYTAGMAVEVSVWDGEEIKLECVAELPLMIEQDEYETEVTISQDDGFAVSIFTLDLFRYKLKVFLPKEPELFGETGQYKEINIKTAGGKVSLDGYNLNAALCKIETKNADVSIVRATGVYTVNTRSGNVYMDYDYLESATVIESESGNVEVRIPDYHADEVKSKLRVSTARGKFDLIFKDMNLPENYPLL